MGLDMYMVANKLLKPFGIARAVVCFAATGEYYIHPELTLQDEDGRTVVRVRFQAHRIDRPDPYGSGLPAGDLGARCPHVAFDFGFAYSACYAPRFESAGSSYGEAELANLHALVGRTTRALSTRFACDLANWVEALKALGCSVRVRRWVGQGGNNELSENWLWDLLPEQRAPGARFIVEQAEEKGA